MFRALKNGLSKRIQWCLFAAALTLTLAACNRTPPAPQPPVGIVSGDTCAVCGMYIEGLPGPHGEAYIQGRATPLKFGSTRDFFAYVTRADLKSQLGALYVQNTKGLDWKHPSNAASSFIDARKAWYVAFQPLQGGMGPTLAAFARKQAAETFVQLHGGEVLRFAGVTPSLVTGLGYRCPAKASGQCVGNRSIDTISAAENANGLRMKPGMKMAPSLQ